MPRLDHSIESRRYYEAAPKTWPPPDLQLPDVRKLGRKAISSFRNRRQSSASKGKSQTDAGASKGSTEESRQPRRALSIDGDLDQEKTKIPISNQEQSPLFRLPLELRQKIYSYVFGFSNIHIRSAKGGHVLRHIRCKCADGCPGTAHTFEHGGAWKRTWTCDASKYDIDGDRVPPGLLRVCRKVYTEAVEILYLENTFCFKDVGVLGQFAARVLPQRIAVVPHMRLDVPGLEQPPSGSQGRSQAQALTDQANVQGWQSIIGFTGLRSLEIRVHDTFQSKKSSEPQRQVPLDSIQALSALEHIRKVKLLLPPGSPVAVWMNQAPFEVDTLGPASWPWLGEHREFSVF